MSEEEIYKKIVEMLSNGNFLQLNGKAINLTELNEYINAQQEEIERLQDMDKILRNENINLKLRINKAIIEIKKRSSKEVADLYISILKGDEKE